MGRNNADFNQEASKPSVDMPGFGGTMAAFDSLIKSGEKVIDKRKKPDEE